MALPFILLLYHFIVNFVNKVSLFKRYFKKTGFIGASEKLIHLIGQIPPVHHADVYDSPRNGAGRISPMKNDQIAPF